MTVEDFLNAKITYRLPFTREELRFLLVNETIFKRYDKIDIDQFVKNFFPDPSATKDRRDASKSSEDEHSLNRSGEGHQSVGDGVDKRSMTEDH